MTNGPRLDPALGERVAGELRATAARQGVSHAEIARRIERPAMWLSRRLSPSILQPMTLDDLGLIAGALQVSPSDVLAAAAPTTEVTR